MENIKLKLLTYSRYFLLISVIVLGFMTIVGTGGDGDGGSDGSSGGDTNIEDDNGGGDDTMNDDYSGYWKATTDNSTSGKFAVIDNEIEGSVTLLAPGDTCLFTTKDVDLYGSVDANGCFSNYSVSGCYDAISDKWEGDWSFSFTTTPIPGFPQCSGSDSGTWEAVRIDKCEPVDIAVTADSIEILFNTGTSTITADISVAFPDYCPLGAEDGTEVDFQISDPDGTGSNLSSNSATIIDGQAQVILNAGASTGTVTVTATVEDSEGNIYSDTTDIILTSVPQDAVGLLKVGDYVQFGQYAGEPILWRVIEDSANPDAEIGDLVSGDPLLFSDIVICDKPFDAAGPHGNNSERLTEGSNLWQTSNLRAWLNSYAEAGAVVWPDGNPPTEDKVSDNAYASEKGFLADGNFSEYERSLIKPVTQKSLLYYSDRGLAEGGSTYYDYNDDIDEIVSNYDIAWYHILTDYVFLLDPKQVYGVYNLFGSYYRIYGHSYWLRAPDTYKYIDSSASNVHYIRGDGTVMYKPANNGSIGVRPALMLYLDFIDFAWGYGSAANPYVIGG